MKIRHAKQSDIEQIEKLYERIHDVEERGLTNIGWIRNIYPTRKTVQDALNRKDLFIIENKDKIVSVAIINQIQVEEYKFAKWKYDSKENEVMVLHTLATDPNEFKKGYGSAFIAFYENYAKEQNCTALRMDTNILNLKARKFYQNLGFEEVGVIDCIFNGIPNVQLICLEKYIGK